MDQNELLISQMRAKSKAAFVEAIKIYNDPTSQIRVESFLFLICTAWEMAFKARLLIAGKSIWYKDKRNNKSRTISLYDATRLVLSDERAPLRQNLDAIIGVRNSAQHLVVPEYAYFMNPLFLANIHGFCDEYKKAFNEDLSESLPAGYLCLFVPQKPDSLEKEVLISKYGKEIAKAVLAKNHYIECLLAKNSTNGTVDSRLAITIEVQAKLVGDPSKADILIAKAPNSVANVKEIKVPTDAATMFPLSYNGVVSKVVVELEKQKIAVEPPSKSCKATFNTNTLKLFIKAYKVRDDATLCYCHKTDNKPICYSYSLNLVAKIVDAIRNDSEIFKKIVETTGKKE